MAGMTSLNGFRTGQIAFSGHLPDVDADNDAHGVRCALVASKRPMLSRSARTCALLTAVALLPAIADPLRAQALGCVWGWGEPHTLTTHDGRYGFAQAASAATVGNAVLVVGFPSFAWATPDSFDSSPGPRPTDTTAYLDRLRRNTAVLGFMLGQNGKASPVPRPEPRRMVRPILVNDTVGRAHMVWAERRNSGETEAQTLWYSQYVDGRWGPATKLFESERVTWIDQAGTVFALGGDLHIFSPFSQTDSGPGVAYVRRINGRWRSSTVRILGIPLWLTAQASGSDSLIVAFSSPDVTARVSNGSHVYVARVATESGAWNAPRRVQWSGRSAARKPRLFRIPDGFARRGALLLVWAHERRGMPGIDTVLAMRSQDEGVTWSEPQAVALSTYAGEITTEQDDRGIVHVVAYPSTQRTGRSVAFHITWQGAAWSSLDSMDMGSSRPFLPAISRVGRDSLFLTWGRELPASPGAVNTTAPVTMFRVGAWQCAR